MHTTVDSFYLLAGAVQTILFTFCNKYAVGSIVIITILYLMFLSFYIVETRFL